MPICLALTKMASTEMPKPSCISFNSFHEMFLRCSPSIDFRTTDGSKTSLANTLQSRSTSAPSSNRNNRCANSWNKVKRRRSGIMFLLSTITGIAMFFTQLPSNFTSASISITFTPWFSNTSIGVEMQSVPKFKS